MERRAYNQLRSAFYLVFFLVIVLRMYMPDPKPQYIESRPHDNYFFCVFMCIVTMIVTECFIIMFAIYLAVGLYQDSANRVEQYLIGRFCALLLEISTLVILIFNHNYFMGWYLIFLMIIILELYSFIVVYSYYVDILEEQKAKECASVCGQDHSEYDDYMNYDCLPESQDMQETQDMRASRCSRASRNSRASRDGLEWRYIPEPRNMPEARNMPGPRNVPDPRNMPEPCNMTGPQNMPELRETRTGYNTRSMRLAREKLFRPDNMSDYRDAQCTRNSQDPKFCLCVGYKTPPY